MVAGFEARRGEILHELEAAAAREHASLGAPADYDGAPRRGDGAGRDARPSTWAGSRPSSSRCRRSAWCSPCSQNQKYFPLFDAAGKLTNRFLLVATSGPPTRRSVVHGNERVVRPRLADAQVLLRPGPQEDPARLARAAARQGRVPQQARHAAASAWTGCVMLAQDIQKSLPRGEAGIEWAGARGAPGQGRPGDRHGRRIPRAAGRHGPLLREADGEPPSVCRAIEQHYWPRFAGDALPTGDASIAVALADNLDALVGMFAIGQVPTGDKDPFALRRAALGIVRILIERRSPLRHARLVDQLLRTVAAKSKHRGSTAERGRDARLHLRAPARQPARAAATARTRSTRCSAAGRERPRRPGAPRLEAVRAFAALPEAASLAAANKRIGNILKKAEARPTPHVDRGAVRRRAAEQALYAALAEARAAVARPQFAAGDYTGYLQDASRRSRRRWTRSSTA